MMGINEEHNVDRYITNLLRPHLLPLLIKRNNGLCEECSLSSEKWEIDHKEYGPHVTISELQLLCSDCHKEKTKEDNKRHVINKRQIRSLNTHTC